MENKLARAEEELFNGASYKKSLNGITHKTIEKKNLSTPQEGTGQQLCAPQEG